MVVLQLRLCVSCMGQVPQLERRAVLHASAHLVRGLENLQEMGWGRFPPEERGWPPVKGLDNRQEMWGWGCLLGKQRGWPPVKGLNNNQKMGWGYLPRTE
jgi:hypothetical protein